MFTAYRSRMQSLPAPESIRSMFPCINERTRKRRCFADKELESIMIEREKLAEKHRQTAYLAKYPLMPFPPALAIHRTMAAMLSPSKLESVWQAFSGDMDKVKRYFSEQMPPVTSPTRPELSAVMDRCSDKCGQWANGRIPAATNLSRQTSSLASAATRLTGLDVLTRSQCQAAGSQSPSAIETSNSDNPRETVTEQGLNPLLTIGAKGQGHPAFIDDKGQGHPSTVGDKGQGHDSPSQPHVANTPRKAPIKFSVEYILRM